MDIQAVIKQQVTENPVVLYMKGTPTFPQCGFSASAVAVLGDEWTLSTLIGYGIAAALAMLAWRSPRVNGVSMQVAQELGRVSWPNLRETRA